MLRLVAQSLYSLRLGSEPSKDHPMVPPRLSQAVSLRRRNIHIHIHIGSVDMYISCLIKQTPLESWMMFSSRAVLLLVVLKLFTPEVADSNLEAICI